MTPKNKPEVRSRPSPGKVSTARVPRVLIEEWLPAAAIGVECIRERSTGQQPPDKRLHVWWARRPLTVSRAAVLGSLLPADFPRDVFERLLGFGKPGKELVEIRRFMDTGIRLPGGFGCDRAFKRGLLPGDLAYARECAATLWGEALTVIDPMAGGGSIPLESARLGFLTLANEYNPVACSVLEATVDYPFRFGETLAAAARRWGETWEERISIRLGVFFPPYRLAKIHAYIFARTVPCPDTQHETPLVPDWHLLKPKSGRRVVAEPIVDAKRGTWSVRIREVGRGAGQLGEAPAPTYSDGKGVSLFTGRQIPADYIKAMAQAGKMRSRLYAVAVKRPLGGLDFAPPEPADLKALDEAERELARLRTGWERANVIPTEKIPVGDKTGEPMARGIVMWADMFTPRQLLAMGVLVEELRRLRPEIVKVEGEELGEAVVHLLSLVLDKFVNYNSVLASWHAPRAVMRSVFDRHDFAFKPTFAEMPSCNAGAGVAWSSDNVLEAFDSLARLPRNPESGPVTVSLGSATNLPQIIDGSITAVVADPPYADNVQYSELADFFYVWLRLALKDRYPALRARRGSRRQHQPSP